MSIETDKSEIVMCQLIDPDGVPLGSPVHIPQQAGPLELTELANKLLNNEEKLPYAFYVSGEELCVPIGAYLDKITDTPLVGTMKSNLFLRPCSAKIVEKVLTIIYQQQAVYQTRPVSRISATIAGHTDSVLCVSFSPDGKQLASGSSDTTVRLWNLRTQTPMFTCRGHRNAVLSIAWSPDGNHLVSGAATGEVCCWKPKTGELDGNPLTGHKKWITSIAWEPVHLNYPCRRFVTSSEDGDARIWDITLGKSLTVLSGHTHRVTCVKWGGEGVIYTSSQDGTIKMWKVTQGGALCLKNLELELPWGNVNRVDSLALSTEYVLRTGAFDHTGKQYSSPEEIIAAALKRYEEAKGKCGERLVSVNCDYTMYLREQAVSEEPRMCLLRHNKRINHVLFSPNGQWIASASDDKTVRIWDAITGDLVTTFRGHVEPVFKISWSPDSRMVLSCSRDATLKIWEIGQNKLMQDLLGHSEMVFAVDWSPDGERVASGGYDRHLKLWVG